MLQHRNRDAGGHRETANGVDFLKKVAFVRQKKKKKKRKK